MNFRALFAVMAAICITAGCANHTISGGTETGNPDITTCAKKMCRAALEALHTNGEWKPSQYLDSSLIAAKIIAPSFSTHSSFAGVLQMHTAGSTRSDTVIVNDSFAMVYDTAVLYDTAIVHDTVFVNTTLHRIDTLSDTLSSPVENGVVQTVRVRKVRDSMTIVDTLIVADTIPRPRLDVIIKILHFQDGIPFVYAVADTVVLGGNVYADAKSSALIAPSNMELSGMKTWEVANIFYNQSTAQPNYTIVSKLAPDTLRVTTGPRAFVIASTEMFMSSKKTLNGAVIETVDFSDGDSTMRIARFPANASDTVQSLSMIYKLYPGLLSTYSAQRISFCNRHYTYRYGDVNSMDISLTIDPLDSLYGDGDIKKGMIKILVRKMNGETGAFDGMIDNENGLSGLFVKNDRIYQLYCDTFGNVQFGLTKNQY